MASKSGIDLWSEMIASEGDEDHFMEENQKQPEIAVVYRRKQLDIPIPNDNSKRQSNPGNQARVSFVAVKRNSRNHSLSIRGRTSIAVAACVDYMQPREKKPNRKKKPPIPRGKGKGKAVQASTYEKEQAYFQEVDEFELIEESPSPKNSKTWTSSVPSTDVTLPPLATALQKWLISKRRDRSCVPYASLSKILHTPLSRFSIDEDLPYSGMHKTPIQKSYMYSRFAAGSQKSSNNINQFVIEEDCEDINIEDCEDINIEDCEDINIGVQKVSLTSNLSSLDAGEWDSFKSLLEVCEQSAPSTLLEVFSKYCNPESIVKIGEGTYGEAFKAGETVCKIVPFDGDLRVNGEIQKRANELLGEVILSRTLNHLREEEAPSYNSCASFIRTTELSICHGVYDAPLVTAWEDWDVKHGSENDHPKAFTEQQHYVMFVLENGGQDLESFVLMNFEEATSLLVQVTVALAVAEVAYEFEHRDLHWGNILLRRKDCSTLRFTLEGKENSIATSGILVSIIDFTLSRINTGEDILFLDLSLDPEVFEGPKGDKQADTYRRMRDVTQDCWEGSFPKTNVLWLQYLVDIILLKKSFDRTSKDERELRSLKKRMNGYNSAREAARDPLFQNLLMYQIQAT